VRSGAERTPDAVREGLAALSALKLTELCRRRRAVLSGVVIDTLSGSCVSPPLGREGRGRARTRVARGRQV